MRDRKVVEKELFYGFSLDPHVTDDRRLRVADRFTGLSETCGVS